MQDQTGRTRRVTADFARLHTRFAQSVAIPAESDTILEEFAQAGSCPCPRVVVPLPCRTELRYVPVDL